MGRDATGYSIAEAGSMLAWWLESGVDVAVQDQPREWLRQSPEPANQPAVALPAKPEPPLAQAAAAEMPDNFLHFREWLGTASLPLASAAAKRILPRGAEGAPIMLIAEAPDAEDAADGQPIGGEAWKLAERMLAAIKIPAEDAYVASISCFHAPGSRLDRDDLEACAAIARRHVALARPQRLLLLGDGPALALLGKRVPEARGHVHKVEGVRTVATYHPRRLITHPQRKADSWKDLLLLMEDEQ